MNENEWESLQVRRHRDPDLGRGWRDLLCATEAEEFNNPFLKIAKETEAQTQWESQDGSS